MSSGNKEERTLKGKPECFANYESNQPWIDPLARIISGTPDTLIEFNPVIEKSLEVIWKKNGGIYKHL